MNGSPAERTSILKVQVNHNIFREETFDPIYRITLALSKNQDTSVYLYVHVYDYDVVLVG